MKVAQQLQVRMEQLGVSTTELARRVGVSAQAVRHWLAGRSFPSKRQAPKVEQALSFNIDFTEGAGKKAGRQDGSTLMERTDVELVLMISKLEPKMRVALHQLVEACLASQAGNSKSFTERHKAQPVEAFYEKGQDVKRSTKRASG